MKMHKFKWNSYRKKLIYKGGIYHITQRAPGKESLFLEESDYLTLLYLIKKYAKDFKVDIFCFCLMPNHIHLLLRINKPNLPEAMKSLFTAYAMRFNGKYERKGHVFCGVYRAVLCLDDIHLMGASLYIHLNPEKAKLVKNACEYKWSSVKAYTRILDKTFLKTKFILKMIDKDLNEAISSYKKMLKECTTEKYESVLEEPKATINFTKSSIDRLMKFLSGKRIKKDFIFSEKNIDDIIEKFKRRNKKYLKTPTEKKAIAYLIEQLLSRGFNITEISKKLNISRPTTYKFYKKG